MKTNRIFEMDALILEALKLVRPSNQKGKPSPAHKERLEKKDVKTSKDIVEKLIESLEKP
jgi:hypothetical protein